MDRERPVIRATLVALYILGSANSAEQLPAFGVGKPISTAFLLELTDPERTGYRIGIVNAGAANRYLVAPIRLPDRSRVCRRH